MNLTLHALKLDDQTFEKIVKANPEWNFEQTAGGELVVVPPTGGTYGNRNSNLSYQLEGWNLASDAGRTFDSNTMFVLPNGAKRMPDASWVKRDRWEVLTTRQRDGYPPLCPDFVVELRSLTDSLEQLQAKMQEYMDNGARLGWLINPSAGDTLSLSKCSGRRPQDRQVEIYRPGQEVEVLRSPTSLSGEDVLPSFVLSLQRIFV